MATLRLILLCALLVIGCSSSPKPLTLKYTTAAHSATLMLPSDWSLAQETNGVIGKSADGKADLQMNAVARSEIPDFKAASDTAWENIGKIHQGGLPPLEDAQIDGRPARLGILAETGRTSMMAFIDGKTSVYVIMASSPEMSAEQMRAIANTFKEN